MDASPRTLAAMREDQEALIRAARRRLKRLESKGVPGGPEYWEALHHLYRARDVLTAIDRCIELLGPDDTTCDY